MNLRRPPPWGTTALRVGLVCALMGWAGAVQGQVRLQLRAASPDVPLREARVLVPRLGLRLAPDSAGVVLLPALRGTDTLRIVHPEAQHLLLTASELAQRQYTVLLSLRSWLFDEVVVAASRAPEAALLVPQVVQVAERAELQRRQPLTSADAVEQMGVFVQRSQLGGGSPVLRGFEASRVLLMIDGVRMNNAIYRSGHLQNLITVDPAQLERIEVVAGPGSSLYGSDALGGTVHLTTRGAVLADSGRRRVLSGEAALSSASAAQALTGHLSVNLGGRRWAARTSLTLADIGDLRAGNIRLPIWGALGERRFTQTTDPVTGADVAAPNPDRNRQTRSGYRQLDLTHRLLFQPRVGTRLGLNAQFSTSSSIDRYDRLSEANAAGVPRFAQWYYGPQLRVLLAPSLELERRTGPFLQLRVIASVQLTHEDRLSRRWNAPERLEQRERPVSYSLNADAARRLARHELNYGLELNYQTVSSRAALVHRSTGLSTDRPDLTRYPAGGSRYWSAALYLSDRFELARGLWANAGARAQLVGVSLQFIPENNLPFPLTAHNRYAAAVGNASLVWLPRPAWRATVQVATGFRAPNVDDLGKFFEAPPGLSTGVLIVPNPDLQPERTTNLESTVAWSPVLPQGSLTLALTGWVTAFDQALLLAPTAALGTDSVLYNGSRVAAFSIQNRSRAQLYGATARLSATRGRWSLRMQAHYTHGQVRAPVLEPLDHIPPVHGSFGLRYTRPRWNIELSNQWNGWKWRASYRPFGEDNLQYATPLGMPAWMVWTLRAEAQLSPAATLHLAVENLQDLHYRAFASGISAPGRNLLLALRYRW